ncbi:MAG TPA: hypothetical protein PLM07_04460 [Candidatus Rifleibacterium sp.]|nr:hypothetical protein [Candidatus Rifleibacterium sp.]HPT45136.1 hypothetical protein [Candidatus Rifleibacterium sp.]
MGLRPTDKSILRRILLFLRALACPTPRVAAAQDLSAGVTAAPVIEPDKVGPSGAATQDLYVVWDALGDGRVVGIFDNEPLVRKILAVNPFYYRFYKCRPGEPTRLALEWLDEKQRRALLEVLAAAGRGELPKSGCH